MRRALFSDRVGQMRSAYRRLSCACRHPIKPEEPSRKCRSESSKFRLENRSPATIEIVAGCSLPPAGAALPRTARYDDVRFPPGLVVRWARQRLTRVPIFGPRRLSRGCATQFRKAHNQLFETGNLLLAVLQLELFVRHRRHFMGTSIVVMLHIEPFLTK